MYSLKGKTAIITGGGSGIGQAISILFGLQRSQRLYSGHLMKRKGGIQLKKSKKPAAQANIFIAR